MTGLRRAEHIQLVADGALLSLGTAKLSRKFDSSHRARCQYSRAFWQCSLGTGTMRSRSPYLYPRKNVIQSQETEARCFYAAPECSSNIVNIAYGTARW